ncbi:glycosyltransferase family 2 protein [Thermosinus carboxydivorans]|uniref:glycosyltransferase family 2 protein n=1 Tax=Thermosinus carboxydivorans TaxID=261685 RepID=UPI000305BE1E
MKISGYIITKNNERSLGWALESVSKYLDEIIIVDSGSTDRTLEIAARYTDKIYFNEFKNFAEQRNFAIKCCTGDWIYTMDADEVMGENLPYLFKFISKRYKAILIPRYNLVSLEPLAFIKKPHYSDWQVRLFLNDDNIYYDPNHPVHHQLINCKPRLKLYFVNIFHLHWLMYE